MRIGPAIPARPTRVLTVVHSRARAGEAAGGGAVTPVAPVTAVAERLPAPVTERAGTPGPSGVRRPAGYAGWNSVSAPFVAHTIATLVEGDQRRPANAAAYARTDAALDRPKGRTLLVA